METTSNDIRMKSCMLCPRKCGVNRTQGEKGVCGQTDELRVARAALHMWEEPCISGSRGSGAVFFSGCALHCVFCQNHAIADGAAGKSITVGRLTEIFLELQAQGANNINLVTAGHFTPQVMKALDLAKRQGLTLPVIYNTSAYEEAETIRSLEGYVDVYLPDLKYVDPILSRKYSHASNYFGKAGAAIAEMVRQTGEMKFVLEMETAGSQAVEDQGKLAGSQATRGQKETMGVAEYQRRSEQGESLLMTRGVIVRHLLLPGCMEDSKRVLDYLLDTYGDRIFISIMNQYTPLPHVAAYPELNRRVTDREYNAVIDYALERGLENGFIQEGGTAEESFIPEFDNFGV